MAPATATKVLARPCPGDCSGDGRVTIEELVRGVNAMLATAAAAECSLMDGDRNGRVTVAEVVSAVGAALRGCRLATEREG
jgi:hypothetical protein